MEKLPFLLALSLLGATTESPSEVLRPHLTHGTAAVRGYLIVMGWIIRKHLTADAVTPPLLLNVENTLGYWIESLALCRSLHTTEDDFWRAIEDYRPIDMPDQFADRVRAVREATHLIKAPGLLLYHEARIQKLIIQHALQLNSVTNSPSS